MPPSHSKDPLGFLTVVAGHLTDDGMCVLTTPAAEIVDPATEPSLGLEALSPGFHYFLYLATAAELLPAMRSVVYELSARRDSDASHALDALVTWGILSLYTGDPIGAGHHSPTASIGGGDGTTLRPERCWSRPSVTFRSRPSSSGRWPSRRHRV